MQLFGLVNALMQVGGGGAAVRAVVGRSETDKQVGGKGRELVESELGRVQEGRNETS